MKSTKMNPQKKEGSNKTNEIIKNVILKNKK
jgi:hypothetical protein